MDVLLLVLAFEIGLLIGVFVARERYRRHLARHGQVWIAHDREPEDTTKSAHRIVTRDGKENTGHTVVRRARLIKRRKV